MQQVYISRCSCVKTCLEVQKMLKKCLHLNKHCNLLVLKKKNTTEHCDFLDVPAFHRDDRLSRPAVAEMALSLLDGRSFCWVQHRREKSLNDVGTLLVVGRWQRFAGLKEDRKSVV